ncbi:threonine ammonia-lyase [Bradyrhizobium iriomotense]|uniref:Serine/threonine dehydratase n=1 Tax=Bradyrhizobium iriomotense TaxID=441950 RepID=A0ABQ6BBW4_9BRAD|nr:threonine/serine dehydratase [Bradyrhizobium iriomotense]GLR91835.1 serine/threonine dehydratase [Bradyrhizobium iriomotense]
MITINDISEARSRLNGMQVVTPLLEYDQVNDRVGGRVLFKAENLQRTGSFKFRGAFNKIASLGDGQRRNGVVAFSSGNHAQGVAAAAKAFGIAATIVMPEDAPVIKRENTRRLGAVVVLYDRHTGDRAAMAKEIAIRTGAILFPPYDDEMIISGQGTIGMEIVDQLESMGARADLLLCPVGGGGLVAGVSTALKALRPEIEVYCVEPEGFDDTRASLERGERTGNSAGSNTICDAIVTQILGEITFPINLRNLAGGFAVSDQDVVESVRLLFNVAKLVVEPGGAVGLAALVAGRTDLRGRTAVVVLSGGNVDLEFFKQRIA